MTAISIATDACIRLGLSPPNPPTVVNTSDDTIREIRTHMRATCQSLTKRYPWQALVRQSLFLTFPGEIQGPMTFFAPDLFQYIVNDTVWNRTQQRQLRPLSAQEWNRKKSGVFGGIGQYFRISAGFFTMIPAPPSGEIIAFEYMSGAWNVTATSNEFVADLDITIFDEDLVVLGTSWRWRKSKGLDYSEEFREYENLLSDLSGRDGASADYSIAEAPRSRLNIPAIWAGGP